MHQASRQLTFPQCVVFDLDNTLYPYLPSHKAGMSAVEVKLAKDYGVAPDAFGECFAEARHEMKQRLGPTASSHSRLLYFSRTLELLGFKSQPLLSLDLEQSYWRSFLKRATLFPGVIPLLEFLKASNVAIAIVTDLTAQIQFRKIIHFDLDRFVDAIVTSEEAGVDKAGLAPFKLILRKLNIPSAQTWVVGDDVDADMQPALSLSMTAIYKCSSHTKPPNGVAFHFHTFDQLQARLESLRRLATS